MTDTATRLCFQTYLHQLQLSFANRVALNANDMSPDGSAPFLVLQLGNQPFILSNFEGFVDFQNNKVSLSNLRPVHTAHTHMHTHAVHTVHMHTHAVHTAHMHTHAEEGKIYNKNN